MSPYNTTSLGFAVVILTSLAAVCLLGGCAAATATEHAAINRLVAISTADLKAAEEDAVANDDQRAAQCYPALSKFILGLQTWQARPMPGAVSAFQRQRDIDKFVLNGPPAYLDLACEPLVADVKRDIRGLEAKFFSLLAQAVATVNGL